MAAGAQNRVNSAIDSDPKAAAPPLSSPSHRATVAAGFVTGLLSGLRGQSARARGLLAAAGLPAAVLAEPRVRVPIEGYVDLYNRVVAATADEAFNILPTPVRPGTFEFLCRTMIAAPDLGEALQRASRFLKIVMPDLEVSLVREPRWARLQIVEVGEPFRRRGDPRRIFAFEWLLRLVHGLACWSVARPLALESARFPYLAPYHAPDYALIYTPHATFGASALEATFEAALLDLPVRRSDAELAHFLQGGPGKITLLYRRDRDAARAVRDQLSRSLPLAGSLDEVARSLGMAPRTLHRRLHAEGTSFRGVKDALRRELALDWLAQGRRSVAQVATELGYSEPSAFFRAFQGWTGQSPSSYRRAKGQNNSGPGFPEA